MEKQNEKMKKRINFENNGKCKFMKFKYEKDKL